MTKPKKPKKPKKPQHHTRSKPKHTDSILLAIEKVGDCLMEEDYDGAKSIIEFYEEQLKPVINPSDLIDYLGINVETTERLHRSGVHTVADLKRQTRASLRGLRYISGSDADDVEAAILLSPILTGFALTDLEASD